MAANAGLGTHSAIRRNRQGSAWDPGTLGQGRVTHGNGSWECSMQRPVPPTIMLRYVILMSLIRSLIVQRMHVSSALE